MTRGFDGPEVGVTRDRYDDMAGTTRTNSFYGLDDFGDTFDRLEFDGSLEGLSKDEKDAAIKKAVAADTLKKQKEAAIAKGLDPNRFDEELAVDPKVEAANNALDKEMAAAGLTPGLFGTGESSGRIIPDDDGVFRDLNAPPPQLQLQPEGRLSADTETNNRGFGDAPGSILGSNPNAGENWGGQLESRTFGDDGRPLETFGPMADPNLSDDQPIRPDIPIVNPVTPGPPGSRDSGTMVDPQTDLQHYGDEAIIRTAIENGSIPLDQLTDEMQRKYKVGPYAETLYPEQGMGGEPSIPRDQLPTTKEELLIGIENGTIDYRAVPTSVFNELDINQTEITNATAVFRGSEEGQEGAPPERLGEATDNERKQQLIDGVANGDIDPLLISKGELAELGIEGEDLVLPAPSEDFITKTRGKLKDVIGDLAEELGPAIVAATAPPSLEEMLNPNNGATWQIGVKIDANGDSKLYVKIGLPIPGLTGDGWEIDLTKDGQIVVDDAIRRKAGEIWENVKKIPEKVGGWWGGVKQEIEDAGEEIKDAALDKDGNVLITVIESTGKVVKRVLRPLEIFLPQVSIELGDPKYGTKVRNGVFGIFILGKIADKIKNKDKPSSSPPGEGSPPAGGSPEGYGDLGEGPPTNNSPFVTSEGEDRSDDDKPGTSIPSDSPDDRVIPSDSASASDSGSDGGGNNPFYSIPGGSKRNRRTEEYESKEGGALEYFFNMAGTSIFATAEQEADFLSAYMRIMGRRKGEDREVSPDKLVSPLTGVNISNPNKKTSKEDSPTTVEKAAGGLINGNFMNEYNRIMRHRVG